MVPAFYLNHIHWVK